MNRLWFLLAALVIFTGFLTGCGNHPRGTPAVQPGGRLDNPGQEAAFPRTYVDARGHEVVIDRKPERVASVFFHLVDTMFTLDMPPVATPQLQGFMSEWESLKPYLAINPVLDLGKQTSVNLEKVLEIQPDLILGGSFNEGIYDDLAKIAPVVLVDTQENFYNWRSVLREVAKVTGKEQTAEKHIAKLEELIVQSRDKLAPYKNETFTIISLDDKGTFNVYGTQCLPVYFDAESGLGLRTPLGYPEKVGRFSLERLAELNPDHIFLKKNKGAEQRLARLKDNSIWNSLQAVKRGNVYFLDQSVFTIGTLAIEYGVNSIVGSLVK